MAREPAVVVVVLAQQEELLVPPQAAMAARDPRRPLADLQSPMPVVAAALAKAHGEPAAAVVVVLAVYRVGQLLAPQQQTRAAVAAALMAQPILLDLVDRGL